MPLIRQHWTDPEAFSDSVSGRFSTRVREAPRGWEMGMTVAMMSDAVLYDASGVGGQLLSADAEPGRVALAFSVGYEYRFSGRPASGLVLVPSAGFEFRYPAGWRDLVLSVPERDVVAAAESMSVSWLSGRVELPVSELSAHVFGQLSAVMSAARAGGVFDSSLASREMAGHLAGLVVVASSSEPVAGDVRVARVCEWVEANLGSVIRLADMCRVAGCGPSTLTRSFQREVGLTPVAWVIERRLEAARRELLAAEPGSLRVGAVGRRFGYAHATKFTQAYRARFGETPTETHLR